MWIIFGNPCHKLNVRTKAHFHVRWPPAPRRRGALLGRWSTSTASLLLGSCSEPSASLIGPGPHDVPVNGHEAVASSSRRRCHPHLYARAVKQPSHGLARSFLRRSASFSDSPRFLYLASTMVPSAAFGGDNVAPENGVLTLVSKPTGEKLP